MTTSLATCALAVAEACAPTLAPKTQSPRIAPVDAYPWSASILSDAQIGERTRAAEADTPGWQIVLDRIGMLVAARCRGCVAERGGSDFTVEERARIRIFFLAQAEIVGVDPNAEIHGRLPAHAFLSQTMDGRTIGHVVVAKTGEDIVIQGHQWPHVPRPTALLEEAALVDALRRHDVSPTSVPRAQFVAVRAGERVELRQAMCLSTPNPGPPPCVDASTGDYLPSLVVAQTILDAGTSARELVDYGGEGALSGGSRICFEGPPRCMTLGL